MSLSSKPIFWILLFALTLRLWGITYGFPFFLVNDEPALVLGALKMIELKTVVPAWHEEEFRKVLNYPPYTSYFYLVALAPVLAVHYLLAGLPTPEAYRDMVTLTPSFLWVAARILNALMGVAVIAITYAIAKRVTASERASLLAAMFLALSFYHIQLSQVVRHWMPALVLISAAWLAGLSFRSSGGFRPYLLAGLFAGLAMGVNTSSVVALLPLALFHVSSHGRSIGQSLSDRRLWAMIGLSLALALLSVALYPYALTRGEGAGTAGGDLAMRFQNLAAKSVGEWLWFLASYGRLLVRYETTLAPAALVGAWLLFRRARAFVAAMLLFALVYFTFLYLFFNAIPRALIFLLPPLAVFAGYGLDRLLAAGQRAIRSGLVLYGLGFLVFFAYPLLVDLRYDYLMSRDDTRILVRHWIEAEIPSGTKILANLPYLRLTNTKDGIRELEALDPEALRAADRVLLRTDEGAYPSPAYHVLNLHFLAPATPTRLVGDAGYFRDRGFRYFIVEYEYANRVDLDPHSRDLLHGLRLVKRFSPFAQEDGSRSLDISGEIATVNPLELFRFSRFGQFVEIYEL